MIYKVSVRNMVEFVLRAGDIDNRRNVAADKEAMQKGSRLHRKLQKKMGPEYRAEVSLAYERDYGDFSIRIEGRADGIYCENGLDTIDEIKGVYFDLSFLERPIEVHLAQAKCYAYFYAIEKNLDTIRVRMTYGNLDTEELRYFTETYAFTQLEEWFDGVLQSYHRFIAFRHAWKLSRDASMHALEFPYEYRPGQREIVAGVYHTIKEKSQLFVEAPTGIGKTMATVFPAVRALGEGCAERIFYLTAKTMTRTVAQEAFTILASHGLQCKTVTLTAKEKICPLEETICDPEHCSYAKGHFDRINDAVYELLQTENEIDRTVIEQWSERCMVCPFELGLDVALWTDAVICDYNYVFDPNAQLARFFGEGVKSDGIFLIDEAHNLIDRGREMYSASICKEDILAAKKVAKLHSKKLEKALDKANKILLEHKRTCETYEILPSAGDLILALMNVQVQLDTLFEDENHVQVRDELLEFYFTVREFLNIYDLVDENYVIYDEMRQDGRFEMKLFCVNPATNLQRCLDKGVAAVFFSATLRPITYYREMFSTREKDYVITAPSPFDQYKKAVLVATDVSSLYTRRGADEYSRIADYIHDTACVKTGNYMVFFPSHKLLSDVLAKYREQYDDDDRVNWVSQQPYMREEEREIFLENFEQSGKASLIGFCVMGGIFAEGIDLIGERLVGAMVIGPGIPQISNEREILKQHFDSIGKNGFDYAYRFPGMNKVLQASGRVIRDAEDTGVILLMDERFYRREYQSLFPAEWSHWRSCTRQTVVELLAQFWDGNRSHSEQDGIT